MGPGAPTAHEIAAALRKAHRAGCQNFDCTFTQFFAWLHDRRFTKKLISDRSGREALKLIFPHTKVIEKDSKTRRLVYRGRDLHEPTSVLMTELRAQYSR